MQRPVKTLVQLFKFSMSSSFKRTAAAGFTLIELLIVVIILAIISAIAIPQFSAATSDAQLSSLDANLATIRNSIEQYRTQHTGFVYPGTNASSGGKDCTGTAGSGDAGTEQAVKDQMQFASNAKGETCTVADTTYRYGPYLRQGIPVEPINNVGTIAVTKTGTIVTPVETGKGWAYDTKTGRFIMNSAALDAAGKAFMAH
jgi:prepilin-type N-terminal cleavage/methylation domain-containing protein